MTEEIIDTLTPVQLILLLECYYRADIVYEKEYANKRFFVVNMIAKEILHVEGDGLLRLSEKGRVWIEKILEVKPPVLKWVYEC